MTTEELNIITPWLLAIRRGNEKTNRSKAYHTPHMNIFKSQFSYAGLSIEEGERIVRFVEDLFMSDSTTPSDYIHDVLIPDAILAIVSQRFDLMPAQAEERMCHPPIDAQKQRDAEHRFASQPPLSKEQCRRLLEQMNDV